MRVILIFTLSMLSGFTNSSEVQELSAEWKQVIYPNEAIIPFNLGVIKGNMDNAKCGFEYAMQQDFHTFVRKTIRNINFFDKTSAERLNLSYELENCSHEQQANFTKAGMNVKYKLVDTSGNVIFEKNIENHMLIDKYRWSDNFSQIFLFNFQKFIVTLRTNWDPEFTLVGQQLLQLDEQQAMNNKRSIGSYTIQGVIKGLEGVGSGVKAGASVVSGVVDILADPALSAAMQQQTTNMQRELDRQRREEIEVKAYSARMAAERRQASISSSSSSLSSSSSSSFGSSSSYSASSSSKSSGSSSSSSGGNSNIGEINKKYQTEREKNLKVQEQKKLEQQKAYEAKLAKEQKEREEEESQREIQLANEKREKDRQAEKERKEREQLVKKQRVEQERNNYLTNVKNNLRLKAVNCYGNNFAVGQIPKGLGLSKHGGINVHYRAYCSGGGSYSGISKNFIGMMAGCFGDTNSHDGGLIPKEVLSCKASEMTVDVTNVTFTR